MARVRASEYVDTHRINIQSAMSEDFQPGKNWSHTLGQDLNECLRRVYYRVYGSWLGWSPETDRDTRLLYMLKNSDSLPTYSGTLVHGVIQSVVQSLRAGIPLASEEQLMKRIETKMRNDIAYSASMRWKGLRNPKRATLILRSHLIGEDLHKPEIEASIDNAKKAFTGFLETYLPPMKKLKPSQFLIIDSLDSIDLRGFKLFLVPDLVVLKADGIRSIIDWKTGVHPSIPQLKAYAVHLIAWSKREKGIELEPEKIEGWSITLAKPEMTEKIQICQADIDEALARIHRDIDLLEILHEDGLERRETAFPKTEHEGACAWCSFKSYCDNRP